MTTRKPFNRARFYRMALFAVFTTIIGAYLSISVYSVTAFTSVPNRNLGTASPADLNLPFEEVSFKTAYTDHITLQGWLIKHDGSQKVLILLHGQNANRTEQLAISQPLWESGYNLLLYDTRGHGKSEGDHHTFGELEQWDIVGAATFLKSKGFAAGNIGIMGWSMGAATAIMGMSRTPDIQAGVSDSGYADLNTMEGLLYPGMLVAGRLLRGMDLEAVKPVEAIQHLGQRHIFLIQGQADRQVPVNSLYRLQQAGGANVSQTWVLPGVGHVGSYIAQPAEYIQRVTNFFNRELL